MPEANDFTTKETGGGDGNRPLDAPEPSAEEKLARIDEILRRMLLLAVSSADSQTADAEREVLQRELDRLRGEIDRIADRLPPLE